MKILYFLFLLFLGLTNAQTLNKIKITDAETGNTISNARILADHQVFYSNDDGLILLPENTQIFEVSAFGFQSEKLQNFNALIKLKPLYKDIDEVNIISVDIPKIFKQVLKDYDEIYFSKPAIYEVTYSQKSFENNHLKQLMIADGKFWSKNGQYNAKDAFKDKFDKFVQLQIDDLRYIKREDNELIMKRKKQDMSQDYIGNLFFAYELYRDLRFTKYRKSKTFGSVVFDDGENQEIAFTIKAAENLIYSGKFILNKKDKAITYFEMNFNQSKFAPMKLKDEDGEPYEQQLGNGTITYDFYKVGEKYVPSKITVKADGFKYTVKDKTYEYRSKREVIFKNFKESDSKGLENPVEINSNFWKNFKMTDNKGQILLSKEEQNFINENNDEK